MANPKGLAISFSFFTPTIRSMPLKLFVLIAFGLLSLTGFSQEDRVSKITLKNGESLTGKILEYKPGEYLKLLYLGTNTIEIKDSDIAEIIPDVNAVTADKPKASREKKTTSNSDKKFRFQSHNELTLGLGVGKIYGFPFEELVGQQANADVFGGFYTANGVTYKNALFAGLGFGFYGHKGVSDDGEYNSSFSMPFLIDIRYRMLPAKTFSPLIMVATGMSYHDGSLGSFSLTDGIGLSVKLNDHLNVQLLFTHFYNRYSSRLSVNNGFLEEFYKNIYLNYAGPRLGVSFTL
jgi:hypothetical protein